MLNDIFDLLDSGQTSFVISFESLEMLFMTLMFVSKCFMYISFFCLIKGKERPAVHGFVQVK